MKARVDPDDIIMQLIKEEFIEYDVARSSVLYESVNKVWEEYAIAVPDDDTMLNDLSKYCNIEVPIVKDKHYWSAIDHLYREVAHLFVKPLKILSPYMAIRYLNPNSSPGFPWNTVYKCKREWRDGVFNDEGKCTFSGADYPAAVRHFFETECCFWAFTSKVELRPLNKLEAWKARGFTAGPVEENLAALMYFKDFNDRLAGAWKSTPYTYGMNPRNGGWNLINTRFPSHWKWWDDDATTWDGGMHGSLFVPVLSDFFSRISVDETDLPHGFPSFKEAVGKYLRTYSSSPMVLPSGAGVWKHGGGPSGGGLTIQVNSLVRRFVTLWYMYSLGWSSKFIEERTGQQVHGDDSRTGSEEFLAPYLNPSHIGKFMRGKGVNIILNAAHDQPVPIEETEYLSCNSVMINGIWTFKHQHPFKLVAGAALGASDEVPEGWSRDAYHLQRLASVCNELVLHDDIHAKMLSVYERYVAMLDYKHVNEKNWIDAKKVIKPRQDLIAALLSERVRPDPLL